MGRVKATIDGAAEPSFVSVDQRKSVIRFTRLLAKHQTALRSTSTILLSVNQLTDSHTVSSRVVRAAAAACLASKGEEWPSGSSSTAALSYWPHLELSSHLSRRLEGVLLQNSEERSLQRNLQSGNSIA
jgi:hypothetical protein